MYPAYCKKKGMVLSTDFMVSAIIFFAIISLTYMTWNAIESKSTDFQHYKYLSQKAEYITELLVRTKGYPNEWNASTVRLPGLLDEDLYISNRKLDSLSAIDQSTLKSLWAINLYHYNLTISNSSATFYSIGEHVNDNATDIVSKSRIILYNNSDDLIETDLNFILWSEQ